MYHDPEDVGDCMYHDPEYKIDDKYHGPEDKGDSMYYGLEDKEDGMYPFIIIIIIFSNCLPQYLSILAMYWFRG